MNELLFLLHALLICATLLVCIKIGKEALITFVCVQAICANLFVLKAISLVGLTATGADAYIIGALLGSQLLQEFWGKKAAQLAIWLSFGFSIFYVLMSQIHITYQPHVCDITQTHYQAILQHMPRIILASVFVYIIAQQFDFFLYGWLKKVWHSKFLVFRNILSTGISQALDTVLFSFLGLYGLVDNIFQIILVSYCLKLLILLIASPFISFAKSFRATK